MPGLFSSLQKGASYVGGYYGKGAGYLGKTGMAAATGAGIGGLYGATLGRDPGQSWYGGAFTGALGGAALGVGARGAARYGGAGLRNMNRGIDAGMLNAAPGYASGIGMMGRSFARGAARRMRQDAIGARRYIGRSLSNNQSINRFSALVGV